MAGKNFNREMERGEKLSKSVLREKKTYIPNLTTSPRDTSNDHMLSKMTQMNEIKEELSKPNTPVNKIKS